MLRTVMEKSEIKSVGEPGMAPAQAREKPRLRILVVEDDPLLRLLNTETLMDAGYQVDAAEDGAAAWAALQRFDYDLLITDHDMPNVTGVGLLKKIHAG